MGLYFTPEKCDKCGSSNVKMTLPHEYECECGYVWRDTVAEFSSAIEELAKKHKADLVEVAKKFPPYQ